MRPAKCYAYAGAGVPSEDVFSLFNVFTLQRRSKYAYKIERPKERKLEEQRERGVTDPYSLE
jgi:hypothetical protein